MAEEKGFDVIIIGGSYAGLSAAMTLGRSLRRTLVIDCGEPCNRQTPRSHNFLTQDGKAPGEILMLAKEQVKEYPTIQFHNGRAATGTKADNGFDITTESGETFTGRKLIVAAGIKDQIPDIPGFAESWGISVIHCPYCHGYEYRSRVTGILANGEAASHYASLIRNLTDNLVILTNGASDFTPEQTEQIARHNIKVIETDVAELEHDQGQLKNVVLNNGERIKLDAMYASLPFVQSTDIPESLGCELTEHGYIEVEHGQKTTVHGVFACGDSATMVRSVANAVASGNFAGAVANIELVSEDF